MAEHPYPKIQMRKPMQIETTFADLPKCLENLSYPPQTKVQLFFEEQPPAKENSILGLFANETELIDKVSESIMQSRENDALRNPK